MNKFKGYLICTDCDGTLTDKDETLSEENAEAIRYFQSEGGLFTLATGRFPEYAEKFAEQFTVNAPVVAMNGTALYDFHNKKLLRRWTAKKADCQALFSYIHKNWPQVWEYWINYTVHDSVGYHPQEHTPEDGSLEAVLEPLPEEIYKMLLIQPEEITPLLQKDLKEKFGGCFRFDTSWQNGLEIQSVASGKGIAVQYMKEQMNAGIHTTVGIGDYENDISLLFCADIGFAVANALDSVKQAADRVTVSNRESAIAAVIRELEAEMKNR